jgi:pentatricopeptide repeat protein
MLTMMKKRALQADPEAYQCLIDACGRVGDTKRATELLAKMHEDGIVADGTVYACLVSAFSAESAWQDKNQEESPEWANSTAVDWNKLLNLSFLDRVISQVVDLEDEDDSEDDKNATTKSCASAWPIAETLRKVRRKRKIVRAWNSLLPKQSNDRLRSVKIF